MSEEITFKEVEVQKLSLNPDDVVVFTLPGDSSYEYVRRFAAYVSRFRPRIRSMVVCGDVKISVLEKEEADG